MDADRQRSARLPPASSDAGGGAQDRPLRRAERGNYTRSERDGILVYDFGVEPRRQRLLVLKLDHAGDFLVALPALRKLRKIFSGAHITLVCGPWNQRVAQASGVADAVRSFAFFTEVAPQWDGRPVEDLARFREAVAGKFDIALDLRVDEDTRHLLQHVDARLKCGIGGRDRHPWLAVILPAEFESRLQPPADLIQPYRFASRMPVRTALFDETDFTVSNTHLIFGPDLALPAGRYRVHWELQLPGRLPPLGPLRVVVDVARAGGDQILASRRVARREMRRQPSRAAVEFVNAEPGARFEFRVHVRGRPWGARLRFFGVWVENLDKPRRAVWRPTELHTGETLSLLVQLVAERTRPQRGTWPPFPGAPALPPAARRIVIAPLSNKETCDWGLANYAELVRSLLQRTECSIMLVGSPAQRQPIETILASSGGDPRVQNLAGRTDWLQAGEIVAAADLVIANNSGIAHLAAASGTPVLAVYSGSHRAEEWGPRGPGARVLAAAVDCSPCRYDRLSLCPNDHLCMKLITPQTVAEEAVAMLAGR